MKRGKWDKPVPHDDEIERIDLDEAAVRSTTDCSRRASPVRNSCLTTGVKTNYNSFVYISTKLGIYNRS